MGKKAKALQKFDITLQLVKSQKRLSWAIEAWLISGIWIMDKYDEYYETMDACHSYIATTFNAPDLPKVDVRPYRYDKYYDSFNSMIKWWRDMLKDYARRPPKGTLRKIKKTN